ncbi:MAG: MFS transporter [Bacillota bacterium]|nr:MFS transporter [Bacillota bacterium]
MKLWVLLLLSFGHFITDIHQGAVPLLLPYIKETFDLSYFALGAVMLVANLSSSIIQPLFGLYSDRVNIPWLLPAGVLLAAAGVALVGVMPSYPLVLLAVFMSGIGIAAFHPEASKMAHFAAGNKKGSAMSIFSVGGNLGFGTGPLIGAVYLGMWGFGGSVAFIGPGLVMAIVLYSLLPKIMATTSATRDQWQEQRIQTSKAGGGRLIWSWGLLLLMAVVIVRSFIHFGMTSFLQFYYIDYLNGDPLFASRLVAVFLICGAFGTLLGGPIADKVGVKKQICGSMGLMIPILYLFLNSSGFVSVILVGLAGATLISTFATTVVMGQQYMPNNIGLASGLMLGFAIGAGGIGVPILGVVADHFGLATVMTVISLLPILGVSLALFLPAPPEVSKIEGKKVVVPVQKAEV